MRLVFKEDLREVLMDFFFSCVGSLAAPVHIFVPIARCLIVKYLQMLHQINLIDILSIIDLRIEIRRICVVSKKSICVTQKVLSKRLSESYRSALML